MMDGGEGNMLKRESSRTSSPDQERTNKSRRTREPDNTSSHLLHLNLDCLVNVSLFLDDASILNLLTTCKSIHSRLWESGGFWKGRCLRRGFLKCTDLSRNDEEEETAPNVDIQRPKRLAHSGEVLRDVVVGSDYSHWRKVFVRGLQRRLNIDQGRFQLNRFLLPTTVDKDGGKDETLKELLVGGDGKNRTPLITSWSGDYLVALIGGRSFYIWRWKERRGDPIFLRAVDWRDLFWTGLFNNSGPPPPPASFHLCKNYLVVMPDPYSCDDDATTGHYSVKIRIYDLESEKQQPPTLAGSRDFPPVPLPLLSRHRDLPHMQLLEDKVVLLCRTPQFRLFVLGVPDGGILREVSPLPNIGGEAIELCLLRTDLSARHKGILAYTFQDMGKNDVNVIREQWVLIVDLSDDRPHHPPTFVQVYSKWDRELELENLVSGIALLSGRRLACCFSSFARVMMVDFDEDDLSSSPSSSRIIKFAPYLGSQDREPATLHASNSGHMLLELRRFGSSYSSYWRLHAYTRDGRAPYSILASRPELASFGKRVSVAIDDDFLYVADGVSVALFESGNGVYVGTLSRTRREEAGGAGPSSYQARRSLAERADEERSLTLAERGGACGIMVGYKSVTGGNFPVVAEVMSFW